MRTSWLARERFGYVGVPVWLIVLLLIGVGWLVLRNTAAERQRRERAHLQLQADSALVERERQQSLAAFELEYDRLRYELDFTAMTVVIAFVPRGKAERRWETYDLRRAEGHAWQYRMPDEAFRSRVAELRPAAVDEKHPDHADAAFQLESLGERPEWIPMTEPLAAKVESRYELFLRHFKG